MWVRPFLGDEEGLGDLAVRAACCGELGHAALARRQRVRAGPVGGPGPDADGCELGPSAALQGSGAAAGSKSERLERGLPSCRALSGGADCRAQIEEHTRMLDEPRFCKRASVCSR